MPLRSQERPYSRGFSLHLEFQPCLSASAYSSDPHPPPPMHPPPQAQTCQDGLVNPKGGGFDGEDTDVCRDFVPHCGESREEEIS